MFQNNNLLEANNRLPDTFPAGNEGLKTKICITVMQHSKKKESPLDINKIPGRLLQAQLKFPALKVIFSCLDV